MVVNWVLLVLILVAAAYKVTVALDPQTVEEARRDLLPVEAVAYLETSRPPGPLFNSYNWGGYLIWAARDYPVYVDGRTDLYDDALLRDYLKVALAQPGWDEHLDQIGANAVLIETDSPLAQVLRLSKGWDLVYRDHLASLYVREVPLER